ncbi:ALF repeat-containing protein [Amycolatopsis nigrescens]|uniref:ALF repeat-containing protein n=1 Tax=Amycolatopsis nigrescens TaxID=381445 RepID=UPI0003676A21|nr:ALF repeat-containing protein [Amycolatopsis nigrescens]
MVLAVFAGGVEPVAAAPAAAAPRTAVAAATDPETDPRPIPDSGYQEWDGITGMPDITGDPRLRAWVADFVELDPEPEVREAAAEALRGDDAAIMAFISVGVHEARARAAARKQEADRLNRVAIEPMAGTGGPIFNAEVTRVLAGEPGDRADFLAYGKDVARQRDEQTRQFEQQRLEQNRARVTMLADVAGAEVRKGARTALETGDSAIAEFLRTGYQAAAKRDADAREAYLKDLEERNKAAEQLTELAKKAARAAVARKNLLIAHGNGIQALQRASNAMVSAANEARRAAKILAEDESSGQHQPDAFRQVKAEVARQLGYAGQAATDAQQASATATVQANILVETGLTYGAQWAQMAHGMAAAAAAAVSASQTAQHAIDATEATDLAQDAQQKAEAHAEQARKWRAHAEEHARSAATIAEAARVQAVAAQDAAARARQARVEAEAAEQQAWAAARRAHESRLVAEAEQQKAAAARAAAERERANAAASRAEAERQGAIARSARGNAELQAGIAHSALQRALAEEGVSAQAANAAQNEERNAAASRDGAIAAERTKQVAEAKAQMLEAAAAQARGTSAADAAQAAATQARAEANTATEAAIRARSAANVATGAAAQSRAAATESTRAAARARAEADKAHAAAVAADAAATQSEAHAASAHAFAVKTNVKAAEATAAETQAAEHARSAVQLAEQAASEATQSLWAAERTKAEAEAASNEAVSAATQAGVAVRASLAARASSQAITDPANAAIKVVAPFTGSDLDADFVAFVAEEAKKVGAEQAKAAQDRANEAGVAAQQAADAAANAADQVKPAFNAASAAAASSAAAARSAAEAQQSAAAAAVDGAAARAAGARANQADAQARADAQAARRAANAANSDAVIAGRSAAAAEQDAAAARSAAGRAEADAAAARNAATRAEADAAAAQAAADRAQENADRAAEAARNARDSAVQAQQAADRAEEQARRDEAERRRQVAEQLEDGGGIELTPDELELLFYEGDDEAVQQYHDAYSAANKTIIQFLLEIGADVLVGLLGIDDAKRCFGEANIEGCIWTVVNIGKFLAILGKLPEVGKAIFRAVAGIGKFLESSKLGKKILESSRSVVAKAKNNPCYQPSGTNLATVARTESGEKIPAGYASNTRALAKNSCINWNHLSKPTFGHTFNDHGAGLKNTGRLLDRARVTGNSQGQWLDNNAAVELLKNSYKPGFSVKTIEIPPGLGQAIRPDGSIIPATHATLVPARNGLYKTAYPVVIS